MEDLRLSRHVFGGAFGLWLDEQTGRLRNLPAAVGL